MTARAVREWLMVCPARWDVRLVTTVASGREPSVVSGFVAICARQCPVLSGKITANLIVVKARRRKRPLAVASSASRR
ncbi:MAG: hypothetical protein JKY56_23490 [Kofleriaceae bacterium]|nr:hypothetical protein [Kofleriaceae bacterium]